MSTSEHPEARCDRCRRPNVWSWHAPSPLWNAVMRDPITLQDAFGIVCPPCFAELAEAQGVVPEGRHTWHFAPHGFDIAPLWADRDGRVWDPDRCLWVDAIEREAAAPLDVERLRYVLLDLAGLDYAYDARLDSGDYGLLERPHEFAARIAAEYARLSEPVTTP